MQSKTSTVIAIYILILNNFSTSQFNPVLELFGHLLDHGLLLDGDHGGAGQLLGPLDCVR